MVISMHNKSEAFLKMQLNKSKPFFSLISFFVKWTSYKFQAQNRG